MAGRTPWHFWVVAILALLWNGMGAYDYVMTQTENAAYLAMFTPEQVEYFTSWPLWFDTVWAIGVWAAVLGAILLILRRAWAAWLFALSLLAVIIYAVYTLASPDARAVLGAFMMGSCVLMVVVAAFEYFYSQAMKKRGVLR
jgi:hypothetical protein